MDTKQDSTENSDNSSQPAQPQEAPKQELKLPVDISKFKMPSFKMPAGGLQAFIQNKLGEYRRVLSITKKPDMDEYKAIVKASGLGLIVIGMLGFIITMIVQAIQLFK